MSYKTNNRHRKKDLFITTNGKATWTVKLSKLKLGIFFQTSSTHFVKISTARVDQNRTAVLCFMVLRSLEWIFVMLSMELTRPTKSMSALQWLLICSATYGWMILFIKNSLLYKPENRRHLLRNHSTQTDKNVVSYDEAEKTPLKIVLTLA